MDRTQRERQRDREDDYQKQPPPIQTGLSMDPTSVAGCQRVEHEARPLEQLVNVVSHSTAAFVHGPFGRITHHSGRQTRTKKSYVKHVAATRVYPNEAGHSLHTPILLPLSSYFFGNKVEQV